MENWRDNYDDDIKTSTNLAKYGSVEDALRGADQLAGRLGRSITMITDDSSDDEKQEYYKKLQATAPNLTLRPDAGDEEHAKEFWKMAGVPDDAKGYTATEGFDGLPDDYQENLRKVAVAAGWTNKQYQDTLTAYATEYATLTTANEEARDADIAIVDGKFGLAKEQRMSGITALAEKFADPDNPPAWLSDTSLLTAGDILLLNNVAAAFQGKGPQATQLPAGGEQLSPDEISAKQSQLRTRLMDEQYTMPRDEYKRLVGKLAKLGQMATNQ